MAEPLIRDISDTARWMAVFRARESERPEAVFKDPFAQALAGDEVHDVNADERKLHQFTRTVAPTRVLRRSRCDG
jgi:O-methyltransferase involved in polyketide biosynthesis